MSEKVLEVEDLEVVYKTDMETVRAVNGISFSVTEGETLGIVGETGAGKTTTALSILRLLPGNSGKILNGSIRFRDCDLLSLHDNEMQAIRGGFISMIFQDPMTSLNPLETVGDQIAEALYLHTGPLQISTDIKRRKRRRISTEEKKLVDDRVDETLRMVGIPPFRKHEYPHQFSGGMKQRVVIAIALACEPTLLIADEPTTALDVTIQAQVLAMIDDLRGRLKTSMIIITHDLGIVAQTCDKVAVMYAGEIIEYGFLEDVFEVRDNHPYTKGLFGSIPDIETETRRLSPIAGLMPDPTNLPAGCKFSNRCPECMEICKQQNPGNFTLGTHMIKCFLFEHWGTPGKTGGGMTDCQRNEEVCK